MPNNPFQYLLPVNPEDFVGRWSLVRYIATDLTQINANSHAIIAGRRFGKSSLLNAIVYQLRQPIAINAGNFIGLPILFDFKCGADTFESVEEIFALFLRKIYHCIDASVLSQSDDISPQPIKLTAPDFLDLVKAQAISLNDFEESIGYILDQFKAANQHVRLILLLDEIDDALERPWTQALFSQLRYLVYSSDKKSCIKLVVSGSHRFLDQVSLHGSPLWNVFKLHYLESFDEAGFKELASRAEGLSK